MAEITDKTTDENGNIIYNVTIGKTDSMSLATSGTYVDKNIIFNTTLEEDTVVTFTVGSVISTEVSGLTAYSLTADKELSELLTEISDGGRVYGKLTQSGSVMSIGEGFPEVLTQNELLFETAIKYIIDSDTIEEIRAAVSYTSSGAALYIYQNNNSNSSSGSGTVELTAESIISALGYTPYNATNPNNYKSSILSSDVTNALGFTPYNSSNPSNYVTKSVTNLTNYYTKTEVNDLLSNELVYLVVASLPTSGISTNTVYLVKDGSYYDQYMYINKEWVMIGTTSIDLSDYVEKSSLANVATTGNYEDLTNKPNLAVVATTGSYYDLTDTPAIPINVSELTNDCKYVKTNDLGNVKISTFTNDVPYAKMSDITALESLDVDAIQKAIDATKDIGTVTHVKGGTGLTGEGTTDVTINHSNSVTENISYPTGTTTTNGGSFTVRDVKYDSTGHITSSQDREISLPTITEYDDTEVRGLISNETSARSSADSNLQEQITTLDGNLSTAIGRIDGLDTTTSGLDSRITAIENNTCVIYISDASPSSDTGEDGDVYIQA